VDGEGDRGSRPWARAQGLFAAGLSLKEVAEELGISKTSAHRLKREIEEEAALAEQGVGQA
jgi:transposase